MGAWLGAGLGPVDDCPPPPPPNKQRRRWWGEQSHFQEFPCQDTHAGMRRCNNAPLVFVFLLACMTFTIHQT
jgi:hypothetical protein